MFTVLQEVVSPPPKPLINDPGTLSDVESPLICTSIPGHCPSIWDISALATPE